MERLNQEGRKKVNLLKNRELVITAEAEKLMKDVENCINYFLHSNLSRK